MQALTDVMQDGSSRQAQTQVMQALRRLLQGAGKDQPGSSAETSWAALSLMTILPSACVQLQGVLADSKAAASQADAAELQVRSWIFSPSPLRNLPSRNMPLCSSLHLQDAHSQKNVCLKCSPSQHLILPCILSSKHVFDPQNMCYW